MSHAQKIKAISFSLLLACSLGSGNLFADNLSEKILTLRERVIATGTNPVICTQPNRLQGHPAGSIAGTGHRQDGVAGSGNYPMHIDTDCSIDLTAALDVPVCS